MNYQLESVVLHLPICKDCGKRIKFIRKKGGGGTFKVNPEKKYFIPSYDGAESFITSGGYRLGREVYDDNAEIGYKPHYCRNGR